MTTAAPGPYVFISYAHVDQALAFQIVAYLEAQGLRCWIAPRNIVPGSEWTEVIIDAISEARAVVLVLSASSNTSFQIKRELERAVSRGVPIIPLRIEDIFPSKSIEYFISTHHWLDAFTPPLEPHLEELAAAVRLMGAKPPERAEPAGSEMRSEALPPSPRERDAAKGKVNYLVIFLMVLVAVGLAGGLIWWRLEKMLPELSKRPEQPQVAAPQPVRPPASRPPAAPAETRPPTPPAEPPSRPEAPKLVQQLVPPHRIMVTASSVLSPSRVVNYKPSNVLDGRPGTPWAEGVPGYGVGEYIQLNFAEPLRVAKVVIVNGYGRPGDFEKNSRVEGAILRFSDGSQRKIRLADHYQPQTFTFPAVRTTFMRLTITSVYPGSVWDDTCISEIQVYYLIGGN